MWACFYARFEVVRCQDSELELGPGLCPAKPITECDATCIGLVWRLLSRIVYRVHEVRRKRWWWWWNARNGRPGGGGVLPCQTENRARRTRYLSSVDAMGADRL